MRPEQYQQVKKVFNAALDLGSDERSEFLDAACEGDAGLRSVVEKLLAAHGRARSFIETPALDSTSELLIAHQAALIEGQRIGPYRIVREIGQGGMGAVYLAERADHQYHKQAAMKLVRPGLDTEDILRRFRSERQILANLDHPNIARLIDGGTTSDGLPYIVMEYVEGLPLVEYCDNRRLSTVERLKLFSTVCSAVHYAHQNLVIHRDLKPGNILVTSDGVTKLLDFGIAKVFHPESSAHGAEATVTHLRAMTPEYASPEQVRGEPVTTASDIYSLGVILYQLLTGHRPYRARAGRPDEIARAICDEEPERPSTVISRSQVVVDSDGSQVVTLTPETVSEVRDGHPEKLRRRLKGDLDNIVLMAMRKEPQRRYGSVEQFADDIRRHLEGLPVIARKDTFGYRAGKFIRRNKAGAAAATLVLLTLIAGIIATAWQARRVKQQSRIATQQRDKARLEQTKAERINTFLQQILSYANPSWYAPGKGKRRDLTVLEALDEASRRIEGELNDQPEIKAEIHTTIGDTYRAIDRLDLAEPHFEAALRIRRELFGDRHIKVAESLYYLGGVKTLKGDWITGERLYREAIPIQRAMPNEGNNLPYMLLDLGGLLLSKGDFAAEALFREALEIFRGKHGDDHITVAIGHEYIGTACYERGDLDTARAEFEEALRVYQKTPDSVSAVTLLRLGGIHISRGEYDEAESYIRQALDQAIKSYGENHSSSIRARNYLAYLAYRKADYRAAKREIDESSRIARQLSAGGQSEYAGIWSQLGMILTRTGQSSSAESYLRNALALCRRAVPETSRSVAEMKGALGECLTAQKRYEEAELLLVESYNSLKASQVAQSPSLKEAMNRLATLYDRWQKREMAAQFRAQLSR